jgi:hypothetical protein
MTSQMGVSADHMGNCSSKTAAAMRYVTNTNTYIQELITSRIIACVPSEYRAMQNAFRAASLNTMDEDGPGFHTGEVIVYNEVVHQHVDDEDSGLSVTFCTGSFTGGWMYFSDLKMASQ